MSEYKPIYIERKYLDSILAERIEEVSRRPLNALTLGHEPSGYDMGQQLGFVDALKEVRENLQKLPTVQPQPKKSKAWHHLD